MQLSIQDLTVEYRNGGDTVRPIDSLNLDIHDGELVLLLGPSGSGKTTLLSALAGLLTPTSGSIRIDDVEVTALRRKALTRYRRIGVGVVFQSFNLVPSLTARENVAAPLVAAGSRRWEALERADELLTSLDLGDRLHHRPAKLSGGQQQRVAIARALGAKPGLVLADEPTAHLDRVQVDGVLSLLRGIASPGRIVIATTHDDRMLSIADRVIHLDQVIAPARALTAA
jgi:putative ABC transport system ATP-binding protein